MDRFDNLAKSKVEMRAILLATPRCPVGCHVRFRKVPTAGQGREDVYEREPESRGFRGVIDRMAS